MHAYKGASLPDQLPHHGGKNVRMMPHSHERHGSGGKSSALS